MELAQLEQRERTMRDATGKCVPQALVMASADLGSPRLVVLAFLRSNDRTLLLYGATQWFG